MSEPPVNPFGPADWYRTIRDQIQHEDNLIVQRLSWLMAAQSFFFMPCAGGSFPIGPRATRLALRPSTPELKRSMPRRAIEKRSRSGAA